MKSYISFWTKYIKVFEENLSYASLWTNLIRKTLGGDFSPKGQVLLEKHIIHRIDFIKKLKEILGRIHPTLRFGRIR